MGQPIYFLPGLRQSAADGIPLRKQVLKERGLADIFADVPYDQQPLWELPGRGPDNKAGCLLCYQTVDGHIPRRWGFFPDEQQWTAVGDGSLLWIGLDTAEPPKPEEMARRKQYPGYLATLGDGSQWQVPVIRRPDDSTALPTDMIWDATGQLSEPIKPAYEAYWQETAKALSWVYENAPCDRAEALELAVRALSINYRFGRNEQNVLRVVDGETFAGILAATVDLPGSEKKSLAPTTAPGSQADCQPTALAVGS